MKDVPYIRQGIFFLYYKKLCKQNLTESIAIYVKIWYNENVRKNQEEVEMKNVELSIPFDARMLENDIESKTLRKSKERVRKA